MRVSHKALILVIVINFAAIGGFLAWNLLKDDPQVILNQVGYFPTQDKTFLVKARYLYDGGTFDLVDNTTGATLLADQSLVYLGTMWKDHYWRGNLSAFSTLGAYVIVARLGPHLLRSYPFAIGWDIYDLTLERGYEFFYYQRCGVQVNELVLGYVGHLPCHMDDHVMMNGEYQNLTGGWHSAGDYAKHTYWGMHIIGTTYSCLFSYGLNPSYFNSIDYYNVAGDLTPDGIPDILDEAMFGLEYLERIFLDNGTLLGSILGTLGFMPPERDTDGIVGNADDRWLFWEETHAFSAPYEAMWAVASFAKMASIVKSTGYFATRESEITQHALNIYNNYSIYYNVTAPNMVNSYANNSEIAALLATWELFQYTSNVAFATNATILANFIHDKYLENYSGAGRDELGDLNRVVGFYAYWALQNGTAEAKNMAKDIGLAKWNGAFKPMSNATSNFYGVMQMPMDDLEHVGYFWDRIGLNSYYLTAAFAAFMTYNLTANAEILAFGLRQLDFLFGANPLGTSMFEGMGSYYTPTYHHRYAYIPGNPRGAVPGAIINGIISDDDGQPFLNLNSADGTYIQDHLASASSNEVWLPHNIHYLYAISALYACVL